MQSLTVKNKVLIHATVSRIWDVLTIPLNIRQWDELPTDFDDRQHLSEGTEIKWLLDDKRFTRLTVTGYEPGKILKMNLYNSWWPGSESSYNITYCYLLSAKEDAVEVTVEIGDFRVLPDGENYYNASVEFAEVASAKIKKLSEEDPGFL